MTSTFEGISVRRQLADELLQSFSRSGDNCRYVHAPFGAGGAEFSNSILRLSAEQGRKLLQLNCLPTETDIPFAAISGLLDEAPKTDDLLAVMRQIEASIVAEQSGEDLRALLLIENIQFMDAESAYILTQLIQLRQVDVIMVGTASSKLTERLAQFRSLMSEAPLTLGRLTDEQVSDELERITSAVPTPGSIDIIRAQTGCIYDFVTMFLNEVASSGLWRNIGGHSVIHAEKVVAKDHVAESMRIIFDDLGLQDRQALTQLALAGRGTSDFVASQLSNGGTWAFEAGLLEFHSQGGIVLSSALLESVLRRSTPPDEAKLLLDSCPEDSRGQGIASWQEAQWHLTAGYQLSEVELVEAARHANDTGNYREAFALATVRTADEPTLLRKMQELRAMAISGQVLEAVACLEQVQGHGLARGAADAITATWTSLIMSPLSRQSLLNRVANVFQRCQDEDHAVHSVQIDWRLALVEFMDHRAKGESDSDDFVRFMAPGIPVDVVFAAAVYGLENRIVEISSPEAVHAINRVRAEGSFGMKLQLQTTLVLAQQISGVAAIENLGFEERPRNNQRAIRVLSAIASLASAWKAERIGDYSACRNHLAEAMADYNEAGFHSQAQAVAVSMLVRNPKEKDPAIQRLAAEGQWDVANSSPLFRALSALQPIATPVLDTKSARSRLHEIISRTNPEVSIQGIWHVYRFHGECLREPIVDLKETIIELAGKVSSPRHQLIGELMGNLDGDIEVFRRIAQQSNELALTEIRDMAWAEVLRSSAERDENAAQARRHLHRGSRDFSAIATIAELLQARGLTPRELDVARCAAQGMSNKNAASFLDLSIRTVEGHLYRVYSKLGVSHRSELSELDLGYPVRG